jgi:hypothetical protein
MSRSKGKGDLLGDLERSLLGEGPRVVQELAERLSLNPLHCQIESPVTLAKVVYAADIGVADLPGDSHLPLEAIGKLGEQGELGFDELQGNDLSQLLIDRLEDVGHTALADLLDDGEAAGKHGARGKVGRGGRGGTGSSFLASRLRGLRYHGRSAISAEVGVVGDFFTALMAVHGDSSSCRVELRWPRLDELGGAAGSLRQRTCLSGAERRKGRRIWGPIGHLQSPGERSAN